MNNEDEGLIPLDIPSQWVRPSDALPINIGPYFAYYHNYGQIIVHFDGWGWYWYMGGNRRGKELGVPICYLYVAPVPDEYIKQAQP